jgi:MFS family permease
LSARAKPGPEFSKLWIGQSISLLGSQISTFALPTFAVLALHATPLQIGVLAALQVVPFVIFGLIAGVWLDRWPRRTVMIVADAARFVLLASIPVAAAFGGVSWAQLYAVAFLVGTCRVFFDIGISSLVPNLVPRDALATANARIAFSDSAAQIAGNALGGVIVQLIGAARAIGVDALSYLASIASLAMMRMPAHRRPEPVEGVPQGFWRELAAGVAWVVHSRDLRIIAAATATANLGIATVNAVILLFYYRNLHLDPGSLGITLGVSNVGFVGALFAVPLAQRFGLRRTLIGAVVLATLANGCIPLAQFATPLLVIFAANAGESAALPIYNISQVTYRQLITPLALQGRMNATMRTFFWSSMPLGSLLGGVLGTVAGLVPTIWIGTAIAGTAALVLLAMRGEDAAESAD